MKRSAQLAVSAMLLASFAIFDTRGSDSPCDCATDLPSPFVTCAACEPLHREDRAAHWRHGFDKVRRTWDDYFELEPDELKTAEAVDFEKIKNDPAYFLDRKVQFDVYLGKIGQLYRPFLSPFTQEGYVNFSAWAYGTPLWTKDGRGEIHPLYYIDKRQNEMIKKIEHLPMFTPLHVWGEVRAKSDSTPWIEIMRFKVIPEVVLTESGISHIELGSNQYLKKRFDIAAQALCGSLALQLPVNVEARVYELLGRNWLEARVYHKARNAFVNTLLRDQDSVRNLIGLARADLSIAGADGFAIKDGTLVDPVPNPALVAEAREAGERAIASDPANPEAHAWLGLAFAMAGHIREGYKEIEFAQKLAPRNTFPLANRNRALIAFAEMKLALAKDELNQAVIYRPTDVDLKLELGDVFVALNDVANARLEFNQARELASERVEPWYKIANLLKLQGDAAKKDGKQDAADKFYSEALENLKTALTKDDRYEPAIKLQAELVRAMQKAELQDKQFDKAVTEGDFPGMESAARAALEIVQDPLHYSRLGSVLASKPSPDLPGALEAYNQASRLNPKNAEYLAAQGHIRARFLNQSADAIQVLEQALKLKPDDAFVWQDLAYARRTAGDKEGAIKAADEAVKISHSPEAILLGAQARLDRGGPEDIQSAFDRAKSVLADAKVERDVAQAHSIMGGALVALRKPEAAIEHLLAADTVLKNSAEQNLWYGLALLNTGKDADAQTRLNSAIELSKADAGRSQVSARVMAQAEEALKSVKTVAKEPAPTEAPIAPIAKQTSIPTDANPLIRDGALPRTEAIHIPQPNDAHTAQGAKPRRNAAPIIEEPEQPVPTQVPGPR